MKPLAHSQNFLNKTVPRDENRRKKKNEDEEWNAHTVVAIN